MLYFKLEIWDHDRSYYTQILPAISEDVAHNLVFSAYGIVDYNLSLIELQE